MLPPAPSSILARLSFHALGLLCQMLGMGAMFSWMLESACSWVPDSGLAFPKKQDRGWAENGGPWAKGPRGWVGDASGAPCTPDPPPGSMAKGLGPVLLTTGHCSGCPGPRHSLTLPESGSGVDLALPLTPVPRMGFAFQYGSRWLHVADF